MMNEIAGSVLIFFGMAFNLFGCLGLVRMPDIYNRLQAATKCVTLGTCSLLLGAFLHLGPSDAGVKALLCLIFVLLTAPTSAHAIARGAHIYGVKLWEGSVCDEYEKAKD